MSEEHCPNCASEIKTGIFNFNVLVKDDVRYINHHLGKSVEAYCTRCHPPEMIAANKANEARRVTAKAEKDALEKELEPLLSSVPVLSLQMPPGWSFQPLSIVTAQTVTGTGLFSEIGSAFTDLFGRQSNMFREKLRAGERMCMSSLRLDTLRIGGHAVIATDVNYAEVGGDRAMLMVCMTGTAIKLDDINSIGQTSGALQRAIDLVGRIHDLEAQSQA